METSQSKPVLTGRGGPGRGQGRKPGSVNRLQREAQERAKQEGELPHEILLKMARGLPVRVMVDSGKVNEDGSRIFVEEWKALDVEQVRDAAKAAAPYFAPKLSTVETITGLTDEQLDEIIRGAASEAEVSLSDDGEGPPAEAEEPASPRKRIRIET
jgi:hypothetical protein